MTEEKILADYVESNVPGGFRGTAYHEASHAVVAELMSFPIDYISIIPKFVKGVHGFLPDGRVVNGISVGGCQHVLNAEGFVPLSSSFRAMNYHVGELASIPTERRLGILTEESVTMDVQKVYSALGGNNEATKTQMARMVLIAADIIVNHPQVWSAIEAVAEAALVDHTLKGERIREIMKAHIPPEMYTTEAEQQALSEQIAEEGGLSVAKWLNSKFKE